MTHEPMIEDYLSAYEAANDKTPDFELAYEAGWFLFKAPSGDVESRKRGKDLVAMTERLRAVAESKAPEDEPEPPAFGL